MSSFTQSPGSTPSSAGDSPSAKDKAADVAQTGKRAAGEVAQTAATAAKDVAHEAKQHANDLLGTTKAQLTDQAASQQSALVDTLRSLGDQLASMTDHVDREGTAVDFAKQARDRAHGAASWLDEREPGDVIEELRVLGRKHPGQFLLGAVVAGVAAGRLTRGVVAVHTDDGSTDMPHGPSPAAGVSTQSSPALSPPPRSQHGADTSDGLGELPARDTPGFGRVAADPAARQGYAPGGVSRP